MKKLSNILIIVGLIIIFLAPLFPDWFYWLIYGDTLFDYRYTEMRALEVMPSIKLVGLLMCTWGFVLTRKEEK